MAGLLQRNMNHLVTDLETVIWNKFGGNSTPPSSAYTVDKVTDGVPLQRSVLGQTVFYIVAAVVVQEGRVLMMREAKRSCRGAWYLPAGRVERDESLEEGVVREVREETGLDFQPTSIICIDSQEMNWFRFTFVGVITGGKLKTLQEQDSESLEAGWFTPKEVFSSLVLRAEDIRSLIDAGLKWYETKQKKSICRAMPVKKSHNGVIIRLVVVKTLQKDTKKALFCLLLNDKTANKPCPYFPYKVVSNSDRANLSTMIDKLMKEIDGGIAYKTHGYLNVEHTGKPWGDADGVCLTVLVEIFIPVEDGILNNKYNWFELKETGIIDKIWELIDCKGCVEIVQY